MITSTHDKSCLLDAFAHAAGIKPENITCWLGHTGVSRGFHTQEFVDYFYDDFAIIEIHRHPVSVNPLTGQQCHIEMRSEAQSARFARWLSDGDGVLLGFNKNHTPHAVSWKNQQAHDPSTGQSYDLLRTNSEGYSEGILRCEYFTPTKFLRMVEI